MQRLAEDLAQMEIIATVDELDIVSIKLGQAVTFSVDANQTKSYQGVVSEVHLIPVTTNNVVNYNVVIITPNKDGGLLPGMTANISFIVDKHSQVNLIANAALRFQPATSSAQAVPSANRSTGLTGLLGGRPNGGPRPNPNNKAGPPGASSVPDTRKTQKTLWYFDGSNKLTSMVVVAGISNALVTELMPDPNLAGQQFILKLKAEK